MMGSMLIRKEHQIQLFSIDLQGGNYAGKK